MFWFKQPNVKSINIKNMAKILVKRSQVLEANNFGLAADSSFLFI